MEPGLRNWCWCDLWNSFCLRSSRTFRCELECLADKNVGLAAGRYSGTSRPDLYRTPQALHSVLGPMGPVRHWGVFSEAQWRHFRPEESEPELELEPSLFLDVVVLGSVLVLVLGVMRWRRRVVQSPGAARDRLLRALPGRGVSWWNSGGFCCVSEEEDVSGVWGFAVVVERNWRAWRSLSAENESSTKFDSHSSSAKSSYCIKFQLHNFQSKLIIKIANN